jgi:O-methyltransferase domain/Dimerisation domain
MQESSSKDRARVFSLMYGYIGTHLVSTACKLGVIDALADNAMTSAELAQRLGCHRKSLHRVMRAMAAFGLVEIRAPGTFAATGAGKLLQKDRPGSFYPAVETGFDSLTRDSAWHALPKAIRTGGIAFDIGTGDSFFSYLEKNSGYQSTFYDAMETSLSKVVDVLQNVDFSRFKTLIDVGGANGKLLSLIRDKHPHIDAAVYDRQVMFDQVMSGQGIPNYFGTIRYLPGNFFESIPGGADCYLLSRIINDWCDDRATKIVSNVRAAMKPGASLILIEPVTRTDDNSFDAVIADINMLVYMGGAKRSTEEIIELCRECGLTVVRQYTSGGRHMAFEFVPA